MPLKGSPATCANAGVHMHMLKPGTLWALCQRPGPVSLWESFYFVGSSRPTQSYVCAFVKLGWADLLLSCLLLKLPIFNFILSYLCWVLFSSGSPVLIPSCWCVWLPFCRAGKPPFPLYLCDNILFCIDIGNVESVLYSFMICSDDLGHCCTEVNATNTTWGAEQFPSSALP